MFAPHTTPAQVMAGLHWLAVTGFSPFATKTALQGFREGILANLKQGAAIGPQNTSVWKNNTPIVRAENKINAHYTNVTMGYWKGYLAHASQNIRPEPPIDAQEWYATMDGVVQAVLTNPHANVRALLAKAQSDFQTSYLNALNQSPGK